MSVQTAKRIEAGEAVLTPVGMQPHPVAAFFHPIKTDEAPPAPRPSPKAKPPQAPPKGLPKIWERVIFWRLNPGVPDMADPVVADIYSHGPGLTLHLNVHEQGGMTLVTGAAYSREPFPGHWCYTSDLK